MSTAAPTSLRIALVAPPWYPIPPRGYGGIEAMVADLANALVVRGHDVTLIAAGENGTSAGFRTTYSVPPTARLGEGLAEVVHAARAARYLDQLELDLVHDHCLAGPLTAAGRRTPTVATAHGPVDGEIGQYYRDLGGAVSLVAISNSQRRMAPSLNWAGTVHNAIDVQSFPFREDKEDFVLFLGRCNPDKGVHLAIDAAREAGRRILLATKINERAEREYFDAEIQPRLGPGVEHLGEADATLKRELLAAARCLVFPIQWDEPFGLVMVEAMACGTPVVALAQGAVPEVIVDGVTGFVRTKPDELAEAIDAVDQLSPVDCREHARRNFDVEIMATGYERVYAELTS